MTRWQFRGAPPPPRFNMARYCLAPQGIAREKPALIVIHDPDGRNIETWSFSALEAAILRTAYAFRAVRGLKPPDRVAIRLRNRTTYPLAFFGAIAAGFVPIPVSPELTERELTFILSDSEATAIVLDDGLPHGKFGPGLIVIPEKGLMRAIETGPSAPYADTAADDPAFLIYTSGTTADPKGVLHAQRSAWGRRPMYQGWYGIASSDRVMHAGSFNWTYTLGTGLCDPWVNGATALLYMGEKDPALWPRLLRDHGATIFAAVPGVYRQVLKYAEIAPDTLPTLRHGLTAGEALSPIMEATWMERTGKPLYEALGQSELSTYISSAPTVPPRPGKVGKPQPGRCVVILPDDGVDPLPDGHEGLIAVHRTDPGLMLGYWRRFEEEAQVFRGEWFIGGDAGIMDEDGYIAHLGRRNELMNAGGFRVSPAEVELELSRHPDVTEVGVCEVAVREGVSIIAAFIVLRDPSKTGILAELASFTSTALAAYKRPKEYVIVDALPRTTNGKLKRAELKSAFAARGRR